MTQVRSDWDMANVYVPGTRGDGREKLVRTTAPLMHMYMHTYIHTLAHIPVPQRDTCDFTSHLSTVPSGNFLSCQVKYHSQMWVTHPSHCHGMLPLSLLDK